MSSSQTGPAILVVDDEPSVLDTMHMILERQGYKVSTARGCAEALEQLGNGSSFDVVMTDLNMEREDIGLEVAQAAKKQPYRPVVVIFTGYASVANSRAALAMRVDYLAHKPVEIPELLSALSRLLARRANGGEK